MAALASLTAFEEEIELSTAEGASGSATSGAEARISDSEVRSRAEAMVPGLDDSRKPTKVAREQIRMALVRLHPDNRLPASTHAAIDALLEAEATDKAAAVVDAVADTKTVPRLNGLPVAVWRGDATILKIGAIVNAANSQMLGCFQPSHRCIDNIIHCAAGPRLRETCHDLMLAQGRPEPPGSAKLTKAYNLPCDYVLHTVGPVWKGGGNGEADTLAWCYWQCLEVARDAGVRSVSFCSISTGIFGYPSDEAALVALTTVRDWLRVPANRAAMDLVVFNVFDEEAVRVYGENAPEVFWGEGALEPDSDGADAAGPGAGNKAGHGGASRK